MIPSPTPETDASPHGDASTGLTLHRLWVPDRSEPCLANGFLAEAVHLDDGLVLRSGNEHLQAWSAFDSTPAVLLLGPPGIGKSTEVAQMAALDVPPGVLIDLAEVTTVQDLDTLFALPEVEAWQKGEGRLQLYLDAYDEGRTEAKALGAALLRHLRKGPADRLSVRVACRDADRPRAFENELGRLLGGVEAYALAPLARGHAYWIAAETLGEERAHAFMDEVDRVGAGPLAATPLTLRQLVGDYDEHGRLSDDRVALFENAAGRLAVETSSTRRVMGRAGTLTRDESVALASRVAVLLQFSGRAPLCVDDDTPDVACLSLNDVAGIDETAWTGSIPVRKAIEELVLHSGLFTATGRGHRFVHHSYEEFLAARYLARHGTPPAGVWALAEHPDGTLRPQHRETLAWLAAMDADVRTALLSRDPVAALTYVGKDLEPQARREAIEAFLTAHDEDLVAFWAHLPHYDRLVFDGLGTLLGRWIEDETRALSARIAAVDLSGDTAQTDALDALVRTALTTPDPTLRRRAATVALDLGGPDTADALAPLETVDAVHGRSVDPDTSTASAVRAARFPHALSFTELVRQMDADPVRLDSSGVAEQFADEAISGANLPVPVLAEGLQWLAGRPHLTAVTAPVANAVVEEAWAHAEALATDLVAALLIVTGEDARPAPLVEWPAERLGEEARRALVLAAVHADATDYDLSPPDPSLAPRVAALATPSRGVLRHVDVDWVLERLGAETDANRKAVWALAVSFVARFPADAAAVEAVASADDPATQVLYHTHVAPDGLRPDLPRWRAELERQAERDARRAAHLAQRTTPVAPDPPVVETLLAAAGRVLAGDASAWTDVVAGLGLDPTDARTPRGYDWQDDFRRARAWPALSDEQRETVAEAARRSLDAAPNALPDSDVAAAFRTLSEQQALDTLGAEAWRRHAAVLVRTPITPNDVRTVARRGTLLEAAYRQAPDVVLGALRDLLTDASTYGATIAHALEPFWDDAVADVLADVAATTEALSVAHELLHILAEQGDARVAPAALVRAEALRADPVAFETDGLRFVTDAFFVDPDATWRYVTETLSEDSMQRAVVDRLSHVGQLRSVADVPVPILESLAERLDGPSRTDDDARAFRFRVLRALADAGTDAAVDAVERLGGSLGDHLRSARAARAAHTPAHRTPQEVLALARDPDAAPLRSDHEIQTAVVRSLARLQARLTEQRHGAAVDLWNTAASVRPRDEEEISSYVARHLEDDLGARGVVVAREAEAMRGSKTDILLVRPLGDGTEAQVVVEVKGSWNDEYATGLVEQLAGRYLHETGRRHGVHLVVSFEKALWDEGDSRHGKSRLPGTIRTKLHDEAENARTAGYEVVPVLLEVGPHRSIPHRKSAPS